MALSQCLDDSPARWGPKKPGMNDLLNLQELYNERHRLALEELVSGGVGHFLDFLRKEKIPNFLSDDEMQRIVRSAVKPRFSATVHGDGDSAIMEQSVSASMDCSSVTYFPELSDAEPPMLEIGWPAFTTGSYRGVTRAVAHFQPSYYGECIYSCKEAARRMIKSAKEVIAIVTDSLTDLDIFKDLKEACTLRKVPVYILLDQSNAPSFLKMCSNLGVRLDDLQQMRVRTITGATYFTRSGARIMGKVHERFMLIDGNRVATGSYRFNWTDGKLNSSNLIELSGQISENFDEEFRILYAQSLPIGPRFPSSARNSGIYDHLLIKHSVLASPHNTKGRTMEPVCLTSTPNHKSRAQVPELQPPCEPLDGETGHKSRPASNSSTIGSVEQQQLQEEILADSAPQCLATHTSAVMELVNPTAVSCHVSTQTGSSIADSDIQTDLQCLPQHTGQQQSNPITSTASSINPASTTQGCVTSPSSDSSSASPRRHNTHHGPDCHPPIRQGSAAADSDLRDSFHKLSKERQQHYCTIRTKLEHMMGMLSHRQELADVTNLTTGPSVHMQHKTQTECVQGRNPGLLVDNVGVGTLPRVRCVH